MKELRYRKKIWTQTIKNTKKSQYTQSNKPKEFLQFISHCRDADKPEEQEQCPKGYSQQVTSATFIMAQKLTKGGRGVVEDDAIVGAGRVEIHKVALRFTRQRVDGDALVIFNKNR